MISQRQADILKRIQRDQDPVGKIYSWIPYANDNRRWPDRYTIINFDGTKPRIKDPQSEKWIGTGKFVGCRDGMAFFENDNCINKGPIVGRKLCLCPPELKYEPDLQKSEFVGVITSIRNGIFTTDQGKSFKAEDYGYILSDKDNLAI